MDRRELMKAGLCFLGGAWICSGRSLAVVALLACGIYLVIAVEAFRHDPLAHAERNNSGAGGFTLVGESSI